MLQQQHVDCGVWKLAVGICTHNTGLSPASIVSLNCISLLTKLRLLT